MVKPDTDRKEYFRRHSEEAYQVGQLFTAINLGLAASGLTLDRFNLLLNSAINKMRLIEGALTEAANETRH